MFCSQCGTRAEDGAKFCGACGKQLNAGVQAKQGAAPPVVVQPIVVQHAPVARKGTPTWLAVILGAAGLLVLLVGGLMYAGSWAVKQMEEPVQAHLEAIRKGDYETAYALTSTGFHENVPNAAFLLMAGAISGTLKASTFVVTDASAASATVGTVRGNLVDKKGAASPVAFTVVKEEKGWRVHEIDLEPDANRAGVQ